MDTGERRGSLWSIVLAGADEMRTREFIRQWFGYEKPKQYCTFVGTRSMFQHTLDRAARLTPWERVAIVASRDHQHEVWPQLDGRPAGLVLLQPRNVGTAAAIFLPLTYILARDSQAEVVIYPSDHFIHPEGLFLSAVNQAIKGSTVLDGRAVLLAVKPDSLEVDYGWIKPGRFLGSTGITPIRSVEAFVVDPDEAAARHARATGSLWNTKILAAKARELWSLGWTCFPEIMSRFERLRWAIDTEEELKELDAIYEAMPRRNFSSHLLQRAPQRLAVIEMTDALWSDWGSPERIMTDLKKIGRVPALAENPLPFLYVG